MPKEKDRGKKEMELTSGIQKLPEEGLSGFRENWKFDLLSGFLVFLISLPLALGVAMACGLPPFSGILTAILGGVFAGIFQGSSLAIKSPAAGLIIITIQCVQDLGNGNVMEGYKMTLAVIVLSGIIQMLLGIIRVGMLGDLFPSSAVFGMLAAIGITLVTRQIHTLIGANTQFESMYDGIMHLPQAFSQFNPEIFIIGISCLLILFVLPLIQNKYVKMVPAPMLAIMVAIPLGHYFDLEHQHKYLFLDGSQYEIGPSFLVSLPQNFAEGFTFPNFDKLLTLTSLKFVLMFALVGSLESLVSTKALDNLDPFRRRSDLNKDLFSIGLGNTLSGFLGGLPMITELVRSSANVFNGARTRWSNIFNGLFILIFAITAPGLIHQIPLSALAALLIYVGLRLTSPAIFFEIYKVGVMQFVTFLTTILVTLFTNILFGMLAGVAINFVTHLIAGVPLKAMFTSRVKVTKNEKEKTFVLEVFDAAIFSNFLSLKLQLDRIPKGYKIILDFSNVHVIDHTVMEHIHYYGEDYQKKGVVLQIKGMEQLKAWSDHPLSFRVASGNLSSGSPGSPRENELKALAKSIGLKFKNTVLALTGPYPKLLGEYSRVKYEANQLFGKIGELDYKVSDLSVVGVGDIKAHIYQMTLLTISGFSLPIPVFSLTKERFLDKLMENTFVKDIDFDDHPHFSDLYLLRAEHEHKTRAFFHDELIRLLEQEEIYNIESTGKELLIFKNKSIADRSQIISMIDFGKKLTEKINFRPQPVSTR